MTEELVTLKIPKSLRQKVKKRALDNEMGITETGTELLEVGLSAGSGSTGVHELGRDVNAAHRPYVDALLYLLSDADNPDTKAVAIALLKPLIPKAKARAAEIQKKKTA